MKKSMLVLLACLLLPLAAQAQKTEKAAFAAGCFWCTEEAFEKVPGVVSAVSGYMGGKTQNPTYEQVSRGITGHGQRDSLGMGTPPGLGPAASHHTTNAHHDRADRGVGTALRPPALRECGCGVVPVEIARLRD